MNTIVNKIATTVSSVVLFAAACVMAGLGFAVVATLAFFALIAVGLTLLAAPFVGLSQNASNETKTTDQDATVEDAEVVA